MPNDPPQKISLSKLRDAYKYDLAGAWNHARRRHPDHNPYAFVLYGVEGGVARLWPVLLTEESLTRVANRYLDRGYYETLDESRKALRYSIADSPFLSETDDHIPHVDALLEPHAATLDDDSGYTILAKAAMAALSELDAEGLFGQGASRESMMLLIFTEDSPRDWGTESARKLNPPSVFARFEADTTIEGRYISSEVIAFSRDGQSLYSGGSRAIEKAKRGNDDSLSELVAFDVNKRQLSRRWTYEFPAFGDSIRNITCAPDGKSIVALRMKYVQHQCHTILLRFESGSNEPIAENRFAGEPSGMGVSADGSRIAVSLQNKTCHLFDRDFRPLKIISFAAKIFAPRVLQTGKILLASNAGVLEVNPDQDAPPVTIAPIRSIQLITDDSERLLAVAPPSAILSVPRKPETEFGIHLFHLPTFEPVRTIVITGHQAFIPALSRDGSLLAFDARQVGSPRQFIAVFETATGREIARRKSMLLHSMAFTPDGRSLALAQSRTTTGEAIEFWDFHDP